MTLQNIGANPHNNNPRHPFATFISASGFNQNQNNNKNKERSSCPTCQRKVESLDEDGCWICAGCGRRKPFFAFKKESATGAESKTGGGALKVAGSNAVSGATQIRFEQPKNLAAKDFMKQTKKPKYDKDDQALVKQGFRITHTFEIKPRLDTVENKSKSNSNNYRNRKT
jgi:hypothetical protein